MREIISGPDCFCREGLRPCPAVHKADTQGAGERMQIAGCL